MNEKLLECIIAALVAITGLITAVTAWLTSKVHKKVDIVAKKVIIDAPESKSSGTNP